MDTYSDRKMYKDEWLRRWKMHSRSWIRGRRLPRQLGGAGGCRHALRSQPSPSPPPPISLLSPSLLLSPIVPNPLLGPLLPLQDQTPAPGDEHRLVVQVKPLMETCGLHCQGTIFYLWALSAAITLSYCCCLWHQSNPWPPVVTKGPVLHPIGPGRDTRGLKPRERLSVCSFVGLSLTARTHLDDVFIVGLALHHGRDVHDDAAQLDGDDLDGDGHGAARQDGRVDDLRVLGTGRKGDRPVTGRLAVLHQTPGPDPAWSPSYSSPGAELGWDLWADRCCRGGIWGRWAGGRARSTGEHIATHPCPQIPRGTSNHPQHQTRGAKQDGWRNITPRSPWPGARWPECPSG